MKSGRGNYPPLLKCLVQLDFTHNEMPFLSSLYIFTILLITLRPMFSMIPPIFLTFGPLPSSCSSLFCHSEYALFLLCSVLSIHFLLIIVISCLLTLIICSALICHALFPDYPLYPPSEPHLHSSYSFPDVLVYSTSHSHAI